MKKLIIAVAILAGVSLAAHHAYAQESITTSKYDFVPGEKIIFFDDFTSENIGDFPLLWNTTGSGELMDSGSRSPTSLLLVLQNLTIGRQLLHNIRPGQREVVSFSLVKLNGQGSAGSRFHLGVVFFQELLL